MNEPMVQCSAPFGHKTQLQAQMRSVGAWPNQKKKLTQIVHKSKHRTHESHQYTVHPLYETCEQQVVGNMSHTKDLNMCICILFCQLQDCVNVFVCDPANPSHPSRLIVILSKACQAAQVGFVLALTCQAHQSYHA
jgi:hypothetical protein